MQQPATHSLQHQQEEEEFRNKPERPALVSVELGNTEISFFCVCATTATAAMAAAMRTARLALLLVLLIQIVNMAAVSARPFRGEGWLDGGIQMVVDMLGDNKSGSNPPSHCCN
jgi:hypothetical protein